MEQTKLFKYEKDRLEELQEYNYCNGTIICDVGLADKLKRGVENVLCNKF